MTALRVLERDFEMADIRTLPVFRSWYSVSTEVAKSFFTFGREVPVRQDLGLNDVHHIMICQKSGDLLFCISCSCYSRYHLIIETGQKDRHPLILLSIYYIEGGCLNSSPFARLGEYSQCGTKIRRPFSSMSTWRLFQICGRACQNFERWSLEISVGNENSLTSSCRYEAFRTNIAVNHHVSNIDVHTETEFDSR